MVVIFIVRSVKGKRVGDRYQSNSSKRNSRIDAGVRTYWYLTFYVTFVPDSLYVYNYAANFEMGTPGLYCAMAAYCY